MTKERDLLRRVLAEWVYSNSPYNFACVMQEIRAHLADEEGKQEEEPAAFMHDGKYGNHYFKHKVDAERSAGMYGDPPVIALYDHPSPRAEQRKPLSEEEIDQELWGSCHYSRSFTAGVRFAEKHHGISDGHPDN